MIDQRVIDEYKALIARGRRVAQDEQLANSYIGETVEKLASALEYVLGADEHALNWTMGMSPEELQAIGQEQLPAP